MSTTLIIPGLRSSGPTHWQTWLEQRVAGAKRVAQADWNDPHLPGWTRGIRREINNAPGRVIIVAHSFGALAAAQAASDYANRVSGALLVAPADPDYFGIADYLPRHGLGFPTIVVTSSNDPWISLGRATELSSVWGAELISLGDAGHINTESGFGPWPDALALIERIKRASELKAAAERRAALRLAATHRPRPSDERLALRTAAAMLEQAGWLVRQPHGVPA